MAEYLMDGSKNKQKKVEEKKVQSSAQPEQVWGSMDIFGKPEQPQNNQKRRDTNKKQQDKKQTNRPEQESANLKTDVEISTTNQLHGTQSNKQERTLQRFYDPGQTEMKATASWGAQDSRQQAKKHLTLEDLDDGEKFDQFKNKKTTYKEDLYTTKIDENKITQHQKQIANKVEKEILSQPAQGNLHLAEERQQLNQKDEDETGRYEEMKYSGVYRQKEDYSRQQQQHNHHQQQNQHFSPRKGGQQNFNKEFTGTNGNDSKDKRRNTEQYLPQHKQLNGKNNIKLNPSVSDKRGHIKFIISNKSQNKDVIKDLVNIYVNKVKTQKEDPMKSLIVKWESVGEKSLKSELSNYLFNDNLAHSQGHTPSTLDGGSATHQTSDKHTDQHLSTSAAPFIHKKTVHQQQQVPQNFIPNHHPQQQQFRQTVPQMGYNQSFPNHYGGPPPNQQMPMMAQVRPQFSQPWMPPHAGSQQIFNPQQQAHPHPPQGGFQMPQQQIHPQNVMQPHLHQQQLPLVQQQQLPQVQQLQPAAQCNLTSQAFFPKSKTQASTRTSMDDTASSSATHATEQDKTTVQEHKETIDQEQV